jgi:hypothetical protein
MKTSKNYSVPRTWAVAALVAVGVVSLVGNTGCDLMGGLVNPANILSWGGLVDPGYTSALGLPAYPGLGGYDPTNLIQGAIGYRQDAMQASADGWSDFILQ